MNSALISSTQKKIQFVQLLGQLYVWVVGIYRIDQKEMPNLDPLMNQNNQDEDIILLNKEYAKTTL